MKAPLLLLVGLVGIVGTACSDEAPGGEFAPESQQLRTLTPSELLGPIADGETKNANYVSPPTYRAYEASCPQAGATLGFQVSAALPLRAFVADPGGKVLAEGSGTAIQLRHVCGAAGDKHRVVFRQSDLRATLVNVSLAVTRAPVDAGADARVVDGGGVDAGPPFVVPASLTNRDIDVPMACRRYGKGVTEAFATVLLTLRWDEPHVATAVPMVAVEPFPNDGDPQKFAWPLRNNTAAPLDPLNRSVVSMRTYSYGIFVDGIEKESVSAWHRRYTWTLYLSQGDAPGQVKVTYNIDNVIQPDQLHYYSCKGVLQ